MNPTGLPLLVESPRGQSWVRYWWSLTGVSLGSTTVYYFPSDADFDIACDVNKFANVTKIGRLFRSASARVLHREVSD